jgi:hypothetical protein
MSHRVKMFLSTFIITGLFIFTFYYLSSHIIVDSILLGIVGAVVIGLIISLLIPFIQKRKN